MQLRFKAGDLEARWRVAGMSQHSKPNARRLKTPESDVHGHSSRSRLLAQEKWSLAGSYFFPFHSRAQLVGRYHLHTKISSFPWLLSLIGDLQKRLHSLTQVCFMSHLGISQCSRADKINPHRGEHTVQFSKCRYEMRKMGQQLPSYLSSWR